MILRLAALTLSLASVAFGAAAVAANARDVIGILKIQGFSSSLSFETRLQYLGDITLSQNEFEIYFYDHVNHADGHGLQKIVVIENHKKYAGSYLIDVDDVPLRVRGPDILFPRSLGKIHFSGDGPPQTAFADGQNIQLEK